MESMSMRKISYPLENRALIEIVYRFWESPKMLPESAEVLSKISVPKCVVSNIDDREIDSALATHGLRFDHVVTSESCRAYKQRKEVFERALELLNMKPEEMLHVGDSYAIDVIGAKSAGINVAWVNKKNKRLSAGDVAPDYVVGNLIGLLDIVK
jgi:FMN phosphatase YigB (HAD superfamily)